MAKCPNCRHPVEELEAQFCPNCGSRLDAGRDQIAHCPNCWRPLEAPEAQFCSVCGIDMEHQRHGPGR